MEQHKRSKTDGSKDISQEYPIDGAIDLAEDLAPDTAKNTAVGFEDVSGDASGGYDALVDIDPDSGDCTLNVLVDGVTCALCIQKIESILKSESFVRHARLNFGARRLRIVWSGDAARADMLIALVEGLGYLVKPYDAALAQERAKEEERFLLLCLGVAGFAMGNVMLLSVGVWSTSIETMGGATRDLMHWVSALIALPTLLFSGRPFFRSALAVLSKGHTNMDVPIAFAITLTGGMSLYEVLNHGEHVYFDSALMLVFFLLIGRYLDFKAREKARDHAYDLLQLMQGFADVVIDGTARKRIPIKDIMTDMRVHVAVGESFPVDGVIDHGETAVNTALITGESLPRDACDGDAVFAGTVNIGAPVVMRVEKIAAHSVLADIAKLMDTAEQGHAKYVRLADRAARLYTPVVHALAVLAFVGWMVLGGVDWQDAMMIAVTVLIITCPCALGLAVPVVQVLANSQLMKSGVFVKSGDALERLAEIDTVMLDKTGTMTTGHLALLSAHNDEDLKLAASLAQHSAHPLSRAVVAAYARGGVKGDEHAPLYVIDDVCETPGQGLAGRFDGRDIRLGHARWCDIGDAAAHGIGDLDDLSVQLWMAVDDGRAAVCFCFADELRADAVPMIKAMRGQGLRSLLVSGDRDGIVRKVASMIGVDQYYGARTPPQKYDILMAEQSGQSGGVEERGASHKVLMVGDGLNDAPVLKGAHVSMAPGSAIQLAQNSADIVFVSDHLMPVYDVYMLAKHTQNLVRQNFALALLYNAIAIPFAFCGFVTPLVAALCMSGSSLVVIANSFRLRFVSSAFGAQTTRTGINKKDI